MYSLDPDFQRYQSNGINLTIDSRIAGNVIAGKVIVTLKEHILLLRLMKYVLYSFTRISPTFYIGLLFTRTMAWTNLLSSCLLTP